ncbi:hypothetical protein PR202_ga17265 [Eleusine coracana subsp. coracana]|uniref:FAE domain-containing protein n=1 Tax=Eleusine coracana subsp. coracana TaxID=191504 RepID=A0AAV5CQ33_ELECO|nr:hypothetical protein PR202_ga17265 [Eleusine coracana subsp. coracana]
MSSSSASSQLKQLKPLYQHVVNNFVAVLAAPLVVAAIVNAARVGPEELLARVQALRTAHVFLAAFVPVAAATLYLMLRPRPVYLVDYACFRTQPNCRVPFSTFLEHAKVVTFVEGASIDERSVRFMTRLLERSGLGEETCLPPAHHYIPPYRNMEASRAEVELVVFSAIDDLLAKTKVSPQDIDILIVNCSLFAPVPSFTDMIIHKYKMRKDIRHVHLSGMGCSAGLISVGLARNFLQVAPRGARALVVSTETITPNYYVGKERAMLLPNCLFRMGGAAALLSTSRAGARFRLARVVRTLTGAQDSAYRCVFQEEDAEGHRGINLSKDLMTIAGDALKANITAIGPLVLPASEQLLFAVSFIARRVLSNRRVKPYLPDFRTAFEHFCIHAGGRAVIDELQRSLGPFPSLLLLPSLLVHINTATGGDNARTGDDDSGAQPKLYNNVMYDYDDLKEGRIGQGSGRLPYFDGQFYDHWKCKIMMYLESMCRNAVAASAIISALSSIEYDKVAEIKNTNQLWRKLKVIYKGIDSIKDARLRELQNKFNLFIMGPGEGPKEVHDRLVRIVNQRRALGAKMTDLDINKKLLQALRTWDSNICSTIREKDNFKSFTIDEVLGKLLSQKQQNDQANKINALIKQIEVTSGDKNDIALNAT